MHEAHPSPDDDTRPSGRVDPEAARLAISACQQAGKHLLNVLRSVGIQPDEIDSLVEALGETWPTEWAYDAWCAWYACKLALERAGLDTTEITTDRRRAWRTNAPYHRLRGSPEREAAREAARLANEVSRLEQRVYDLSSILSRHR